MNSVYLAFSIILIGLLGLLLLHFINNHLLSKDNNSSGNDFTPYKKRYYFFTLQEKQFYLVLKEIANRENLILFSKVRVIDLIDIKHIKNYASYRNKIISKQIDFVLLDQELKVLRCIELDDPTHNRTSRIERDKFLNELFEAVDLSLIRIKTQSAYSIEELMRKLNLTDL